MNDSPALSLPQPLRGIVPPMITPLRARDELDVPGLERLIEHILAGGVRGLFILGTSGEAPSLSYRLRRELIDRTCRQVAGRVSVLVGVTDTSFVELLNLARHAAEAGAAALVLAAPYYFPPGQAELLEFLDRLLPELPLPLFLYNMPQMTKVSFELETVRRVLSEEKIVGIKDSSGDLGYFDQLLELKRQRSGWSVLVGPEHLLAETLRRGGDGGVTGGANYHPRLFVELFEAVTRSDPARAAELQRQVLALGALYTVGHHASSVVKGMKCACALLGLCDDFMAEPFRRFREPEREKVRAILRRTGLLA
ncbi:MAG TPA: dihydrodipicolinate synthase family protein [Verrucomicrobiota bacterium]|nr:dihydrodipicolinate synthase family protein [Verrucomicrobiota bacterium]HQB18243.1 dihydrodipicolinate synthase family protein [Verrucomicrobiota bacterium]